MRYATLAFLKGQGIQGLGKQNLAVFEDKRRGLICAVKRSLKDIANQNAVDVLKLTDVLNRRAQCASCRDPHHHR